MVSDVLTTNDANNLPQERISLFFVYLGLIVVVMIWGASWPAGRLIAQSIPPITAAFIRFTIAVPLFFLSAMYFEKSVKISREIHYRMVVLGAMQVTLYNIFFFTGESYTSASDAVLIIAMNPTITAILASKFHDDEKLNKNKAIGLIIAILGVIIIVIQSPNVDVRNRLFGDFIILLAAITWATFTVFSKPTLKQVKPMTFSFWSAFYGWLLLMILSPINGSVFIKLDRTILFALIYLAILSGVFGNIVYNNAIGIIGSSNTSIFVNLVPIFGVISAVFLLGEKFSIWHVVALIFIISGVFLVNKNTKRNKI